MIAPLPQNTPTHDHDTSRSEGRRRVLYVCFSYISSSKIVLFFWVRNFDSSAKLLGSHLIGGCHLPTRSCTLVQLWLYVVGLSSNSTQLNSSATLRVTGPPFHKRSYNSNPINTASVLLVSMIRKFLPGLQVFQSKNLEGSLFLVNNVDDCNRTPPLSPHTFTRIAMSRTQTAF